jgi:hypothetical protein
MHRENVFQPLLVKKYRVELLLTNMHIVNIICSTFFKKTIDNLKSLVQDENKWQTDIIDTNNSSKKIIDTNSIKTKQISILTPRLSLENQIIDTNNSSKKI